MLAKRINRSDPEKIFIVVKNSYSTASLTNGQSVGWDLTAADGVSVTKITTAYLAVTFAGIVAETIAYNAYGLLQVYGYHSAVRVDPSTTEDVAAGHPLYAKVSGFNLIGPWLTSGTTEEVDLFQIHVAGFALAAQGAVGTTTAIAAFIKAL